MTLDDADSFILHCQKDKSHQDLINRFSDEAYDMIFENLDKREAELAEEKVKQKAMRKERDEERHARNQAQQAQYSMQ